MTAKREKLLTALLRERTVSAAARTSGYSERGVYQVLADPEFGAIYAEARRQVVADATARLQSIAGKAVATLESLMDDPDAPAAVRFNAAAKVWELRERSRDREDQEQRIQALEEQLRGMLSRNGNGRAVHA